MFVTWTHSDGQTSRTHFVAESSVVKTSNRTTTDLMLPYDECSESQHRLRLRKGTCTVRIAIPTLQCILARDSEGTPPDSRGLCPPRRARDSPGTAQRNLVNPLQVLSRVPPYHRPSLS
jgi:hypothetical protein